jgi:glycosyltransferase involved in cell wall biosynthesis
MILLSHPTGNANVRAVMQALENAGILDSFCTTLGVSDQEPAKWRNLFFQKRRYPIPQAKLKLHPLREIIRLMASKLGCKPLTRHETGWASIDSVYRDLDHAVSTQLLKNNGWPQGVYGYEDGALETFRTARKLGIHRLYDLPIAYFETAQRLLHEEARRLPAWEPTLGGTRDSAAKLARKAEELELADVVICPSLFVANSLPDRAQAAKKIVVVPFGSPPAAPVKDFATTTGKKLRVLFAGSMTQRKGLGDLLAAMQSLNRNDVELVVMGSLQAPMEFYRKEFADFTYEPGRSHAQVLELMRSCDVFCLPSIVEGRALVMQEAMSQGLPLIITPNAGGEDLINEGITGFLVPIRCPHKIAEKIGWFADNRAALPEMSRAAQARAARLTWEMYGQAVVKAVLESTQDGKAEVKGRQATQRSEIRGRIQK